ncbi:MAG: CNNM domain-containing protein [Candidatus Krumholzibacteriia bacterium]
MSEGVLGWGADLITLVLLAALLGSAFFSGCETGLLSASRVRLVRRQRDGDDRVAGLERLRRRMDDAVLTCLVGTNLCTVASSAVATALLSALLGRAGEGVAVVVASLTLVVFGEIIPKIVYREYPEALTLASVPGLRVFQWLIAPVRWALGGYAALVSRLVGDRGGAAELDRVGLAAWLSRSEALAGEARFRRATVRFLNLSKRRVSDLMRPLSALVTVPDGVTFEAALAAAASSGFSRLPVQGTHGDLDGYLLVRDLLLAEGRVAHTAPVPRELVRPLLLVDPALSPYELFEELHARGRQLAAVVDGEGRALGIVTLEDLIEKVTGAIADEFDQPEATNP